MADTNLTYTVGDITSNRAFYGEAANAPGPADNSMVSLGDKGYAILELDPAARDGAGVDIAIFENGLYSPPSQDSMIFAELAFVEVSSDGEHFVRFPAISNTQTDTQLGSFTEINSHALYNLAGAAPAFKGAGFDLAELADSSGVDISHITHVRVRDVGGCIDPAYASYDAQGNIINDPWPTNFNSSGFDLDAVAVLHESLSIPKNRMGAQQLNIYPNPARGQVFVSKHFHNALCRIFTSDGRLQKEMMLDGKCIDLSGVAPGAYIIRISEESGMFRQAKCIVW